jgi:hypothetical protein
MRLPIRARCRDCGEVGRNRRKRDEKVDLEARVGIEPAYTALQAAA